MEATAAAAAAKKRRFGRPTGQGPLGSDGLDHISRLPDAILGEIISLLPTKDAARTQAVSRRWRPLWRATPLNLDVDSLSTQERKRTMFVSRILASHPGPARRLSLPFFRLRDRYAKLDGWLRSPALADLQELDFSYDIEDEEALYPLPPSALRFAPTLRVVELRTCHFPNGMAPALHFPRLARLTPYRVTISEDTLHGLLSRCSALESLLLVGNFGIRRLRINSPSLRSLGFSASSWEGYQNDCCQPYNLDSNGEVVDFLKCFPCLEKLYVIGYNFVKYYIAKCQPSHPHKVIKNIRSYDQLHPIECMELHLRKVVIRYYEGKRPDVDFAKFFVLNAKVLREMDFCSPSNRNLKWQDNQHRRLSLQNKASQVAQFTFKTTSRTRNELTRNRHTHELSMSDPFDFTSCLCSSCRFFFRL
uniref:F-box domain-containing protein n=1 Tax=Oryza rufipogon TaxID=4529 RepID=A0A0E0Q6Q3_ORYRU